MAHIKKNSFRKGNIRSLLLAAGIGALSLFTFPLSSYASAPASGVVDYRAEAEARKSARVESNEWENWPDGPLIGAQSAILMEANTGTILYEKNINARLYPASTTKILTALITMEKCSLDDIVTYSNEAITSIDWRNDSNMGIKAGSQITVEQSLYGLLVGSANEVGNALAEHISGSVEEFVKLMNERAKELGCTDSNFVTTNGIFDEEHYTSAHDMALIAQAFFSNDLLCKMSDTANYTIPASATLPDEINVHCKNQLLPGKSRSYDYLLGSKTGYTNEARQTLVSCAEKDGLKLICVIMKEESPNQFTDTVELFDYGFSNFHTVNVAESDTQYTVGSNSFFEPDSDVFGDSSPILTIEPNDYIILPNTAEYSDAQSSLSYDTGSDQQAARIDYTYNGIPVGSATINVTYPEPPAAPETAAAASAAAEKGNPIFLNVKHIFLWVLGIAAVLTAVIFIRALISNYSFAKRRRARLRRKKRRRERDIDFERYKMHDTDY